MADYHKIYLDDDQIEFLCSLIDRELESLHRDIKLLHANPLHWDDINDRISRKLELADMYDGIFHNIFLHSSNDFTDSELQEIENLR